MILKLKLQFLIIKVEKLIYFKIPAKPNQFIYTSREDTSVHFTHKIKYFQFLGYVHIFNNLFQNIIN